MKNLLKLAVYTLLGLVSYTTLGNAKPFEYDRSITLSLYGVDQPSKSVHKRTVRNQRYVNRGRVRSDNQVRRVAGSNGRPRAWCGWWMRQQRGGGPEYNLAWNWRNYGSPSGPQVGAVVVWPHHVGQIVGQASNGMWLVQSGNDGGAVRTRARSVKGAIFRI